jgi:hypothetical protein
MSFTFHVSISDSHIITRYLTDTQQEWEFKSHRSPQRVWVSLPHVIAVNHLFNIKRSFSIFEINVVLHYPVICSL